MKDLAVAGRGTYTGGDGVPGRGVVTAGSGGIGGGGVGVGGNGYGMRPTTPKTPKTPKTPSRVPPMARSRPSMETITVGATLVTPLPARPSTSGSGVGRRAGAPERYYSESIYPEQGVAGGDDDEWDIDDRVSKYLDRRFGVVTPRGTTPTSKGWEGSGRPF